MASADFSWQALLRVSEMHPPHVHETSPVCTAPQKLDTKLLGCFL